MKTTTLCLAALVAATFLPAQADKKAPAQQPPNPKVKEHEALATLVGNWQTTCKSNAMPGVPGMEKAQESTGPETCELICNGLWLKSTINSTWDGKPFQGIWLAGWDAIAKTYRSVWISSQEEPASEGTGTWDEKAKTWTFKGKSPMGEFKSQLVFKDNDNSTETIWMTGADGKEAECMQIMRKRGKPAAAREASATSDMATKEMAPLAQHVGNWTGKVTMTMPGEAATEESCTENVVKICNGKWTWSDVKGVMMGMPFEGHAINGYDEASKQFVSFWVDSCGMPLMRTAGTYDEAKKQFTLTGSCFDDQGKPATVKQMCSQSDANTRSFHMIMNCAKGASEMKIAYTRVKG